MARSNQECGITNQEDYIFNVTRRPDRSRYVRSSRGYTT